MKKGKYNSEQKAAIVLAGLRRETPISNICRNNHISVTLYYKWRDRFLEGGKANLNGNGNIGEVKELNSKIHELERIIGKVTIKNEILKNSTVKSLNSSCVI